MLLLPALSAISQCTSGIQTSFAVLFISLSRRENSSRRNERCETSQTRIFNIDNNQHSESTNDLNELVCEWVNERVEDSQKQHATIYTWSAMWMGLPVIITIIIMHISNNNIGKTKMKTQVVFTLSINAIPKMEGEKEILASGANDTMQAMWRLCLCELLTVSYRLSERVNKQKLNNDLSN